MYKKYLSLLILSSILSANETAVQIEKRFQPEIKPKSSNEITITEIKEETKLDIEKLKKIKLKLNSIKIENSTIFNENDFKKYYEKLINKDVTFHDIYEIYQKINKEIKENYFLSRAYIPVQKIKDGNIIIKVQEGFINEVKIINESTENRNLIKNIFEKLELSKPTKTSDFFQSLLLLKDLTGFQAESSIEASKDIPNASILNIKINKIDTLSGFLSVDNRGTKATGPLQITTGISLNNPLGYYSKTDLLYARTGDTKELNYYALNHKYTINESGLALNISTSYSNSEPGIQSLRSIDQKSNSKSLSLGLEYPFIRDRMENLYFLSKLDFRNSNSLSLNSKISEDKTRILRIGLNYDFIDFTSSTNQVLLEYSRGLTILGAIDQTSDLKSRADANINFDKINITLKRDTKFENSNFSLFTAIDSQFSADTLLSGEQCSIGGKQFGRAYDSSEITGDTCYAFTIEPRYTFSNIKGIKGLQTYAYWDIGEVRNKNSNTINPKTESIASAGLGFRFSILDNLSASLEFTKPLTKIVTNKDNKETRIFSNLVYNF